MEKAASAIGALYAAVIGVAFSVTDRPIPARALIPVLFLGLAIVFAMVYLAFATTGESVTTAEPTTSRPERMRRQTERYLAMVHELVGRRRYFLRSAVVALGVGVMCLPAPFIDDTRSVLPIGVGSVGPGTTAPTLPEPPVVRSEAEATVAAIRYQAQIDAAVAAQSKKSEGQPNWPSDRL